MSLFEPGGLRSEAEIRAARASLNELHGGSVSRVARRATKLNTRGLKSRNRGSGDQLSGSLKGFEVGPRNPNAMVEVSVSLPLSMVSAAGDKLDEYVYEGLRDRLNKSGVQWFGPRFLTVVEARAIRAAQLFSDKFTL